MFGPSTDLPHILLLEDDPVAAKIYETMLSENFEVIHCTSVKEAAQLLTIGKFDFDIVLSDYHLEDGTCFDVYQTYKFLKGDGMPPWLLITADPIGIEYVAGQEGLLVLPKPIQREDLMSRLERLTNNNRENWARRCEVRRKQQLHKLPAEDQRTHPWA